MFQNLKSLRQFRRHVEKRESRPKLRGKIIFQLKTLEREKMRTALTSQ